MDIAPGMNVRGGYFMLFSNRDLIKLALPILLQNILATMIGMIDSVMVAGIGEAAVSGVALINSLDAVLITFFSSMVVGGTVIVSQYLGRGEQDRTQEAIKQLLYVTTAAALLITLIGQVFRVPMLRLLFGEAEELVMHHANRYFLYISLSFPMLAITSACSAALQAMGNTTTPMIVSFINNGINIGLNALFIYGLQMETAGAAIASLLSRIVGAVILIVLLLDSKREIHI
jgi:Na+-driven multidrug efflux pump